MAETAAYLVACVIPLVPARLWVLSFPIPLRSLFAMHPELLAPVQSTTVGEGDCTHAHAHSAPVHMSWARLLKRVYDIDIEHCQVCGGKLKIIAVPSTEPILSLSKYSGQGSKNLW